MDKEELLDRLAQLLPHLTVDHIALLIARAKNLNHHCRQCIVAEHDRHPGNPLCADCCATPHHRPLLATVN